ncbi:precorrin-6y C5,15-methyltransferase (decarboxylating) subunit CbiE [Corynebacterium hindlerae]|uniref:precorrin-6y C5,15-methyltransferase (decarboxylating) subunit CbiE n=1 Tax=Corynebacterium hindlerae TaxID=699041 RepID=UPI003AAD360B
MTSPAVAHEEPARPTLSAVDPDFSVRIPYTGVTVVGINPGGFDDLSGRAQRAIHDAGVIIGSPRQLDLMPVGLSAVLKVWPSPLVPAIPGMLANWRYQNIVVLGSGDPMFHGIGSTLQREFEGPFSVIPAPSSVSLACAELKWPLNSTDVVSLVTNEVAAIIPVLDKGRPFLVLGRDRTTPGLIRQLLVEQGQGDAEVTILSDLGGPDCTIATTRADELRAPDSALNVIAITPVASRSLVPGLPDDSYDTDGQLTKQHVRALTIAALEPAPGQLLWDVGGGSGSIAIEYLRSTPGTRAICFEQSDLRRARIRANALHLGVPHLKVKGAFPATAPTPDVVFIGGGLTAPGVFEGCWGALPDGGTLVANAVTVESASLLYDLHAQYGGSLTEISVAHCKDVGAFRAMKSALPVLQWKVTKQL